MPSFDPTTLLMLAVVAVLVLFMIRNNRKRKRDAAEMATKFLPGAEVMTTFGLYGTLVSIDEDANTVLLETSPKVTVKLHRQAISRVVTEAPAKKLTKKITSDSSSPEFGELATPVAKKAPANKATTKTSTPSKTAGK